MSLSPASNPSPAPTSAPGAAALAAAATTGTGARPFRARQPAEPASLGSTTSGGGIFTQLGQEWPRLAALPSMAATLRRWGRQEPALAGTLDLGDLLDRIDSSRGAQEDELLLALVRLAQGGQQLAGRVVLQAMLPKLARMVRNTRPLSSDDFRLEDRRHTAVAAFWEVLSGYPVARRPSSVAGNLALDTLREITGMRKAPVDLPVCRPAAEDPRLTGSYEEPRLSSPGLSTDADLLEVIAWALDVDAVTREDAALLVRVYLPDPNDTLHGTGVAAAAAALGLSQATVRQRCSRARRRLITAVQEDAQPGRQLRSPALEQHTAGVATTSSVPRCTVPT